MRKFSFREISKTLLLCAASLNLGFSSDLPWLGFAFAVAFAVLLFRYDASRVPVYRKSVAYGLIVPFAFWWVLSPEVEYGISPWLVYIPAYYLLSLAYLQKRSLGNGGYDVFVLFNGVAVLLLSCYQARTAGVVANFVALLLLVHAYGRPGVKLWKHALFLLLFAGFTAISFGGFKYWRSHGQYRGEKAADYFAKRHLMGFDPVVELGSFESNYVNKYNREVALRVWDTLAPTYMRAAVYEKYAGGIWKLPALSDSMLYPARYKVDYAVFETHDSASSADSSRPVWVQSTLDNFGFLFAPYGSVAIAAKNADSVVYFKSKIFKQGEIRRGDWFYYVPKDSGAARVENADYDDTPDSAYLQVFTPLAGFLDTVATEMGLDTLAAYPDSLKPYVYSYAIASYFLRNFAYALHIDESRAVAEGKLNPHSDPLRIFWVTRSGYCEYYATLSVLLLRHAGIPARYVTGFARPEVMPGRPYALFRRNSSHAWVELYSIPGRWMPFDPTPPLFVVKTESPSWMTMKLEALRARMARMFHLLRDGEWRVALSAWQDVTRNVLSSTIFNVFFALAVVALASFLVWKRWRRRGRRFDYGASVLQLVRKLDSAEKMLASLGLRRIPGETVAVFAGRCRTFVPATKKGQMRLHRALEILDEYEDERWKPASR